MTSLGNVVKIIFQEIIFISITGGFDWSTGKLMPRYARKYTRGLTRRGNYYYDKVGSRVPYMYAGRYAKRTVSRYGGRSRIATPRRRPAYTRGYGLRSMRNGGYNANSKMHGVYQRAWRSTPMGQLTQELPCVAKWIESLLNPFTGPMDACNPYTLPCFSERVRVFFRKAISSAVFNTLGDGLIVMRAAVTTDNAAALLSTTLAYVNDTYDVVSAAVNSQFFLNSPYTASTFSGVPAGGNQWATVSYGFRIRYVGPVDQMQGWYQFLEMPAHLSATTVGYTVEMALAEEGLVQVPISYDWVTCTWSGPQIEAEMQYNTTTAGNTVNPYTLLLKVSGVNNPAAQAFQIEAFHNFEVVGRIARSTFLSESYPTQAAAATQGMRAKRETDTLVSQGSGVPPSLADAGAAQTARSTRALTQPRTL